MTWSPAHQAVEMEDLPKLRDLLDVGHGSARSGEFHEIFRSRAQKKGKHSRPSVCVVTQSERRLAGLGCSGLGWLLVSGCGPEEVLDPGDGVGGAGVDVAGDAE